MIQTTITPVIVAAPATTTQSSLAIKALGADAFSLSCNVQGVTSPVAAIALQGSNDGVNFGDITSKPISSNGIYLIYLFPCAFVYLRANYTYTSGAGGTVDIVIAMMETV